MARIPKQKKQIETLTHEEAKRRNIPTAEYQSMLQKDDQSPIRVTYERRNRDLDPQLVWRGKDEQDWSDLVVHAPPLYIQEKVHPKIIIDDLVNSDQWLVNSKKSAPGAHDSLSTNHQPLNTQMDLFADFNGIPEEADKTDFYQHDANWTNRMILGDSLQVMASLAEREGLRGKVQCIYLDPPYGIKFNSNFQWSTTSRDVKDGKVDHITREPEQVKAFRDTWRDGIHSYLTYLRDRLMVCWDLLTDSGSIFVQIGDENVHRVRALMDEVFGENNFNSEITFVKNSGQAATLLSSNYDILIWYSKNRDLTKMRKPLVVKRVGGEFGGRYNKAYSITGSVRNLSALEKSDPGSIPNEVKIYTEQPCVSDGASPNTTVTIELNQKAYHPGVKRHWKTSVSGMERLAKADRLIGLKKMIYYRRFIEDFPAYSLGNNWTDTQDRFSKTYVVQTIPGVIQRCILMTTDPGDLVLDPTCGSGTTAYVAEQWGRRWITIDTSRVALALARARIMGARYPFYLLADSPEGRQVTSDQWSVTSKKNREHSEHSPLITSHKSLTTSHYSLKQGFVYQRVPHITLKSIANNAEIDVIWDRFQEKLEPLREQLNQALGESWEEWEIPRETNDDWDDAAKKLHAQWWEHRIARQKEIDTSIAAKANFEYLYDKPYEDKKKVRVAGPFTVESLSPHRALGVDENDELIDSLAETPEGYGEEQDFVQMILENLKTAGVQQAHKEDKIEFTSLTPWPGDLICAEGRLVTSDQWLVISEKSHSRSEHNSPATNHNPLTTEYRAAVFIGPEFGTVSRPDLIAAAREAGDADFDVLITCAFNYDAHSTEFSKLGRIPVLKARMNADLHMADDLKNTGKGNLFVIFGEPDVEVASGQWLVASDGRKVVNYEQFKKLSGLGSLEEINRLGGENLSAFKDLSAGRAVWADKPDSAGGSLYSGEHCGRSSENGNRGIYPVSERGQRLAGGSGDLSGSDTTSEVDVGSDRSGTGSAGRGNQPHAGWPKTVAAIKALKPSDFPLSLTTNHYTQVTIHGVDVFHPNTGEVRSDGAEGIACWFIDTDYNEESFFVRHAYFLGANDPYKALKTTLKAEINADAWATLNSDTSRPFIKPESGRIAVKGINHLGDEVMKVFKV